MTFRHCISGARKIFRSRGLQHPEVGDPSNRKSGTPATGSRGPTDPVIRITPSSVPRSQPRRPGSVQANLFGGDPDDPAAGFCHHMRQLADELQAETGEEQRISGDEDDPATGNPVEETATKPGAGSQEEEEEEAANEDEEEEDPG